MGTQLPSQKRGRSPSSPIFGPFLLWPNGGMHQDATWYGGRPQPRGLCVRCEPSPPSQKGGGAPPQFLAHVYCSHTAAWMKMPLGTEVGLGSGDIVLDGDPALSSPKWGRAPSQISVHVYCGQTAGWIKVALGTEVGLGPGHIVLDGDTAPLPEKGQSRPNFWPMSIVAKRLDGLRRHLVRK